MWWDYCGLIIGVFCVTSYSVQGGSLTKGRDYTCLTKKVCPLCNCHNFFSLFTTHMFCYQIVAYSVFVPILPSFQWYLKYLYRHNILEDTSARLDPFHSRVWQT